MKDWTYTGRYFEPFFERHFRSWGVRLVAKAVILGLLFFTLGTAPALISKANGAESTESAARIRCPHTMPRQAHIACWADREFKRGNMGHDRFRPREQFTHPRYAQRVIVSAIRRAKQRSARLGEPLPRYASRSAASIYRMAITESDCIGEDVGYAPYSSGYSLCRDNGGDGGDTEEGIERAGHVFFCAGGVFFTWWSTAGTATVAFAGTACAFGAWSLWN